MNATREHHDGKLIVVEGIDGTGKSTLVQELAKRLRDAGYDAAVSREPTDGVWGRKIRSLYSEGRESVSPDEELQWFLHDREEHVQQVILPALKAGRIVLLDRYYHSTVAYQAGRGFSLDDLYQRNRAIAPEPDLTLILDLPVPEALRRVCDVRGDQANAFEQEQNLLRVKAVYDMMTGEHIIHLNAETTPLQLAESAWKHLGAILNRRN